MIKKRMAIVTGATSGLGEMISKKLSAHYDHVAAYGQEECDFNNVLRTKAYFSMLADELDHSNFNITLVNCAGVNEIAYMQDLSELDFDRLMNINAKSNFLLAKALFRHLEGGTILSIVSNASRMPMTSSLAYNCSKAAQEMMVKQMARELWQTRKATVFGINPNKLHSTGMTKYIDSRVCETRGWTEEQARDYQLKGLPIGEETNPDTLASFVAFLLSSKENHRYLHGCILPYGGPMGA